jgi:dihydroorotase
MPNLKPPVTTAARSAGIPRAHPALRVPARLARAPDDAVPDRHICRRDRKLPCAKVRPGWWRSSSTRAGATTNSDAGVTDMRKTYRRWLRCRRAGLPLLVHGEVTTPGGGSFRP